LFWRGRGVEMMYLNRWCVLFFLFSCMSVNGLNAAERPNILFIYSDDQNYNTLSCYPESPGWVQTPHIDSLAKQGVRFERTYLGAWCMPSRASFLTGRLQHGVQSMRMEPWERIRSRTVPILALCPESKRISHRPDWEMAHRC